MSDTDEKILQELKGLRADIFDLKHGQQILREDQTQGFNRVDNQFSEVNKRFDRIENDELHTHTALKVVATKGDVDAIVDAAKNEIKADVLNLDAKVVRKLQSHEKRITNIEEHEGIDNPEKN